MLIMILHIYVQWYHVKLTSALNAKCLNFEFILTLTDSLNNNNIVINVNPYFFQLFNTT